jgi:hypothetical protein
VLQEKKSTTTSADWRWIKEGAGHVRLAASARAPTVCAGGG